MPEAALAARIRELGQAISRDYNGKEPLLVGILTGAVLFVSDLLRHITIPCQLDFMATSSYGNGTDSSGIVRILKDLDQSIEGRHVLIVDDIIDTGLTMDYLLETLKARYPASLKVCALLDKVPRRLRPVPIDYRGFEIPDRFVVGYGLDYAGRYRNLPFICVLKPEVYGQKPPEALVRPAGAVTPGR
ncbi:MAG: hypoxanthine phosphoribosyltransferase [Armatimonadota bacterium]|nr:hypoxanthine phosphoribosyltransferase [Armatimonadota bacterium]MDR7473000.1 hypoxanthine phosphoribosyltransferase [Armatimonadota bacterium]MDR7509093.1 hypoxanthine phosphoribosyltransferase [Armatimonadota bacterium]MDR7583839.1 hypoxanthine phosphoribosyltransferase [Armatimonadota bacterium]